MKEQQTEVLCECGKKVEMSPDEAEAYIEAKSHFPFIEAPKCKSCKKQ